MRRFSVKTVRMADAFDAALRSALSLQGSRESKIESSSKPLKKFVQIRPFLVGWTARPRPSLSRLGAVLFAGLVLTAFNSPQQAQNLARDPSSFGTMTCDQIWYLVSKIRADGRVCPASDRAARAFRAAPDCISGDERVLAPQVRAYLAQLRATARGKQCARF